jgi:hypothetical protein
MNAVIERIFREEVREEVRAVVKEYFGSLLELQKGPIVQVHAAVTRRGLTKAVRQTKVSQLADMQVNELTFIKAPKGVSVSKWEGRWCGTRGYLQRKTGFVWRINRDHQKGGVWVTRTR